MAIYDIFEAKNCEKNAEDSSPCRKDRFFSSLTARLLFFLLLVADILWGAWAIALFTINLGFAVITLFQISRFTRPLAKYWISIKRSCVCGISLFISLFSPALGIMIACTYFLMYDKKGVQEVVPTSLQDQFQEFMK